MNYKETLDFLFSQLPMFQRVGKAAYKADLNNTLALLSSLDNPENSFKSIHIAGTNGKGSTSHMLASIFQEAGYKTALYTSPHLIDFRERIRINGELIPEENVIDFIASIRNEITEIKPSFFELTVAMAFEYFKNEKVDIAIIETGLGGRLDSTNVIQPELSIITNIGMDHMQFLGDNILSIAKEKAGIIKSDVPVIIGQADEELRRLFSSIALDKKAPITYSEDENTITYSCDLKGSYQKYNCKTAVVAVNTLNKKGWTLPENAIKKGLNNVRKNTGFSGRWDVLQENPKVICDTGHNAEGLKEVFKQLNQESYSKLHIVLGMVNDKTVNTILKLFPKNAYYYFCKADVPRSLEVDILKQEAENCSLLGDAYLNVKDAYLSALANADESDLIFVGGSTFVVADLLLYLNDLDS